MEIHTNRSAGEKVSAEAAGAPEKSRYLRRKTTQKLRKSRFASSRVSATAKTMGKIIAFALVVACAIVLVVYAYTSDIFALRNISVYGCIHQDAANLSNMIRRDFPKNELRIDLRKLRERLEQETWIRSVEIRRILPSDLVIYVQERVPAVVLEMGEELMLTDDQGKLLDHYDPKYGKLDVPVFKGILGDNAASYTSQQEENSARIKLGLRMLEELAAGSPDFAHAISEVDLSDPANLKILQVDDTAEIYLGDRDFLKRFSRLKANLSKYQELKSQYQEIASIDLRFEGQIIYRPRRPSPAQAGVLAAMSP